MLSTHYLGLKNKILDFHDIWVICKRKVLKLLLFHQIITHHIFWGASCICRTGYDHQLDKSKYRITEFWFYKIRFLLKNIRKFRCNLNLFPLQYSDELFYYFFHKLCFNHPNHRKIDQIVLFSAQPFVILIYKYLSTIFTDYVRSTEEGTVFTGNGSVTSVLLQNELFCI